jgi:hypothetical protein
MTITRTYFYSTILVVTSCGNCGIPFGIPDDLERARRQDGGAFYCPNGHRISWSETENAKLQRQLKFERDRIASERARADGAEASLRATKGHVTRLRKRVIEGECPLCGQHLRDLERHMGRVHPGEQAEVAE